MGKTHRKEKEAPVKGYDKKEDRKMKQKLRKDKHRAAKNYSSREEIEFAEMLGSLGLRIKHVGGDGNCMFRSIADQLSGSEDNHARYRGLIVSYIQQQAEHFKLFMEDDEPFDDYIERMAQHGEWGGHQELYAASQCLRVNVVVHQVDAPRFVLQSDLPASRSIHISYHGECHYNSVRTANSLDDGTPAPAIDLDQNITPSSSSSSSSSASKSTPVSAKDISAFKMMQASVPWATDEDIRVALSAAGGNVDTAINLMLGDAEETDYGNSETKSNSNTGEFIARRTRREEEEAEAEAIAIAMAGCSLSQHRESIPSSTSLSTPSVSTNATALSHDDKLKIALAASASSDVASSMAGAGAGGTSDTGTATVTAVESFKDKKSKDKESKAKSSLSKRDKDKQAAAVAATAEISSSSASRKPLSKKEARLAKKGKLQASATEPASSSTDASSNSGGGKVGAGGVLVIVL